MPDIAYGTGRGPNNAQPPFAQTMAGMRGATGGPGQGLGVGAMSRWWRKKPEQPTQQPVVDERGAHIGRPIANVNYGPPSMVTDYMGLADKRLWDPEARAKFTDRNPGFDNQTLRGLSMAGLRWGGTMGAPRGGMAGQGAGLQGQPDDLRRRILELLAGGGF